MSQDVHINVAVEHFRLGVVVEGKKRPLSAALVAVAFIFK